jgi:hypothetical protein
VQTLGKPARGELQVSFPAKGVNALKADTMVMHLTGTASMGRPI